MDFSLSETQLALQETARRFARDVIRPKAAHYDETAEFPKEIIGAGYELGLINMTIPPELGGAGLSHFEQALVAEEMAWGCAGVATSMIANDLALLPILIAGTDEQKRKFVAPFAQSLKLGSFALTEPGAGSDVAGMSTTAIRDGRTTWSTDPNASSPTADSPSNTPCSPRRTVRSGTAACSAWSSRAVRRDSPSANTRTRWGSAL